MGNAVRSVYTVAGRRGMGRGSGTGTGTGTGNSHHGASALP